MMKQGRVTTAIEVGSLSRLRARLSHMSLGGRDSLPLKGGGLGWGYPIHAGRGERFSPTRRALRARRPPPQAGEVSEPLTVTHPNLISLLPDRSLIEPPGGAALFDITRISERAEHSIERRIADAEPVLFADEVMAQMVLLDPSSEACARRVGNVGDVVHPFVMQDRQHHAEQGGARCLPAEDQREQTGGEREIRDQKPDRQEQEIEPVGFDVMVVVEAVLQFAQERPGYWRRMKSKTVHAVFAEVKHQRAEHDQTRLDGDPAQQQRKCLHHHARNPCAYAAVTKKCEKHFGCPVEIGATVPLNA